MLLILEFGCACFVRHAFGARDDCRSAAVPAARRARRPRSEYQYGDATSSFSLFRFALEGGIVVSTCRSRKYARRSKGKFAIMKVLRAGPFICLTTLAGVAAAFSGAPAAVPARHWAYVKPVRPLPPAVRATSWPRNAIDSFILARLEKEGLRPAPEADRATLIRRVTLDLTGLPPTPEEADAFYADTAPNAYERLVDRLLAAPQFGERWARPWLDLARYADSHGFQRDGFRDLWAWRDWVVNAMNADMPFDQFTIEQIAGDLLPGATLEQKIATGFHRCAPVNVEAGSEPEETRVNQIFDRVNTTAAVWLGTTLECAQCHDHKYDPFTQQDYYRLFAFFNNTAIEADRANPKVPGSIKFLGPYLTVSGTNEHAERLATLRNENLRRYDKELADRLRALSRDLKQWETETAASLTKAGQVHPLEIADFTSAGGAAHKKLADGSVLLVDDPPDKDTYTLTVHTRLTGITGFKLEALTDPSLPGDGPGRGDKERPNFILNRFTVRAASARAQGEGTVLKLAKARADFSQVKWEVAGAIDDDPKSGWAIAPQFHRPHWAIFETAKPVAYPEGTTLTFTLVQEFGRGRTIGRLRLSALTGNLKAPAVPADVVAMLKIPPEKRSTVETKRLLDYRVEQDEVSRRLREQRAQADRAGQGPRPVTTLVMQELAKPRPSAVFLRGNYRERGKPVEPGTPAVLPPAQRVRRCCGSGSEY